MGNLYLGYWFRELWDCIEVDCIIERLWELILDWLFTVGRLIGIIRPFGLVGRMDAIEGYSKFGFLKMIFCLGFNLKR